MKQSLTVIMPGNVASARFTLMLAEALKGVPAHIQTTLEAPLEQERLLFAIPLDESGVNHEYYSLLAYLRTHPGCLKGCVGSVLVDGPSNLYTKSVGRDLVLAASLAGCTFPGRPLVEAIGNLQNFKVQAKNAGCDLMTAYRLSAFNLVNRTMTFAAPRAKHPHLLVLHASSRTTSNTLDLWGRVRSELDPHCDITEIGLRNGTLEDCAGCPYTTCLHFGEQGECFYGGVMVQEVYPALRDADAVVLLCPNYNDALSANITAAINRLTALYRTTPFHDKAVFAMVVSGYSGGDIVASQVVSAMNMNKGFWLPPEFCLLETANDAGTAIRLPGIEERLSGFAQNMLHQLLA